MRRLAALALVVAVFAGCGDYEASGDAPRLTVSAAASLKGAFEDYGKGFDEATARFSFAGSDELAAQIRQGVKPDVYAAANTKLPDQLFDEGLVEKPAIFAGNELVIAVPADSDIDALGDLEADDVDLAAGAESVPVGSYTREVLGGLPAAERKAITANFRSEEPDVAGVVGKLVQGAADAGFVYVTDVVAAGDKLKTVELPDELKPTVNYGVAVVKGAKQPEAAREFIAGLLKGDGLEAMTRAGFLPPR